MIICGLAFTFTLLAVFDLSSFAIGIQAMREELNMSEIEGSLGISLYSFAFGVAPMFLAPRASPFATQHVVQGSGSSLISPPTLALIFTVSEEWGRNVLYISSAIIFALFHIPTALAQNRATVLVSRTILGIAGSTGSTMVGGTISDIFRTKSRGLPMAIFSLAAFTGTGLGAVCCGWVVQDPSLGWRWVQVRIRNQRIALMPGAPADFVSCSNHQVDQPHVSRPLTLLWRTPLTRPIRLPQSCGSPCPCHVLPHEGD